MTGVPPDDDPELSAGAAPEQRFDLGGRRLRTHAARGGLINTAFLVGLSGLGLIRGLVLAAFLTQEEFGLWGVTVIAFSAVISLRQAGIGDKFIQQDEPDQEAAFQRAWTLETLLAGLSVVALAIAAPLLVLLYDNDDLLVPALSLTLLMPASVLQVPLWVFYRRMEFLKQRTLQAIEPIVTFVVSVALAAAGAGYWALFGGVIAGAYASGIAAYVASPYRFKWRYDGRTLRSYWAFSWPLMLATGSGVVIGFTSLFAAEAALGLAGAGAITLAANITAFTDRVDQIVTGTLYPAIASVRERMDLLHESFVKSNRLALIWAVPFGLGLSLFGADLVHFVLGEKWVSMIILLQVYGAVAALHHVGFNWSAYFRARDDTRPMAIATGAAALVFLAVAVPLLFVSGLEGYAIGVAAQSLVHVGIRAYFLKRLFEGFGVLRHAARAFVPTLPAAAAILAFRALSEGERTGGLAAAELAAYLVLVAAATWWLERGLLREAAGYARG
jgi:PST family polysaccharide transporter